jgi:glycosyltransferase involved in cell wall biosynthesis
VALVHDWLTGMRGGEKVLEALCEIWPAADLFTLVHQPGTVSPRITQRRVQTSFVDRLPLGRRFYRHFLPAFPLAIEQFDLDAYDLVVSTSSCAAKSVVVAPRTRHLCYCHSPMRYAWDQFEAYFGHERLGAASQLVRPILAALARWDGATSFRPDRFLANSRHIADRILRYYNRRSIVVPPPVATDFFTPDDRPREGFALVVSALVPYKRVELAIDACRLADLPLTIVGSGPDRTRLEARASGRVSFLGWRSDEEVRELYRAASVVVLPGEEDFGIVPVEAQACGTPVVALGRGGVLDTVTDGVSGVLVGEPTAGAFAEALHHVPATPSATIRAGVERFGPSAFRQTVSAVAADLLEAEGDARRW